MRRLLAIIALLVPSAGAQVYNISSGASSATINSTLATAAAYTVGPVTVNFALGTYTITSQLTLPCPHQPMVITGPATLYPMVSTARPTARLVNALSDQQTVYVPSCSVQRTWEYTEMDGNQPSTGGGAFYVDHPGNNLAILNNYLHGNEEIYPEPCKVVSGVTTCQYGMATNLITSYGYDDSNAHLIYLAGTGDGTATSQQNVLIQYNIFGNLSQTYPLNQASTSSSANLGVASSNGDCVNVQQWLYGLQSNGSSDYGYGSAGGYCVAVGVHGGTTNLHFYDNVIQNQEQGMKFFSCGLTTGTYCVQTGLDVERNDFSGIHRIFIESQQEPTQAIFKNNSCRNPKDPSYGSWCFSVPQSGVLRTNTDSNLFMEDCGNAANPNFCHQGTAGVGSVEFWGSNLASANYNLTQGNFDRGVQWGFGGYSGGTSGCSSSATCWFATNNTCEGSTMASGGGAPGYCVVAEGNQTGNVPLNTNTVIASSPAAHTTPTPSISPASGSFTGSQTVTLTANQFASSTSMPQGNVNVWYTTDGSTPGPHSGTSHFYTGPFSVFTTTTVRAAAMWGGIAQPGSYTTNFGFTPSSAVSATYTGGGGPPTLTSCAQTNTGSITTLTIGGGSVQQIGQCTYSSVPVTMTCSPSADSNGNMITAWGTTNGSIISVSSSGLVAPVGVGTASVTATATGGLGCSSYAFTVSNPTTTNVVFSGARMQGVTIQ